MTKIFHYDKKMFKKSKKKHSHNKIHIYYIKDTLFRDQSK